MEYLIGEILFCLLAVTIISTVVGWLLHGIFGESKIKALEASKNLELEGMRGELESESKARHEMTTAADKAITKVKDLDGRLAAGVQQMVDAKGKHESETSQLKQKITTLEPLHAMVAERDSRLANWQSRFDGLVQEKDKANAAGLAELGEHKSRLAALGLILAAAVAEKESLLGQVSEHGKSLDAVKVAHETHVAELSGKLESVKSGKDALVAELHGKLADVTAQIDGQVKSIDALKAEKDAHVADLHGKLASATSQAAEHASFIEAIKVEKDAHVAELHGQLAAAMAQIDEHVNAIETVKAEKEAHTIELHEKLAGANALHDFLQGQIDAHVKSIAAVKGDKEAHVAGLQAEHSARLEEMTTLLGQRDEQLRSFDQHLRGATAEKDTIIGKLRSMVAQVDPLRQELQLRDEAIEQLQNRMAALVNAPPSAGPSAELDEAHRQIHAMMATTSSLKTALEGKDVELALLAARSAAQNPLEAKLTATLGALSEKEQAFNALELQLTDAQATQQDLLKSKEDQTALVQSQVIDVTVRHAAAQSELDDYSAKVADLDARLRKAADERGAAERTIADKQLELDKARAELASLDTRTMTALDQWKARVSQLEQALDAELPNEAKLRATIQTDQEQMAELRAQIAHRDEQLASTALLQNQVVDLTGRHAGAKAELHEEMARFADLESRMREQTSEQGAASRSADSTQTELMKSQAEVADLDSKLMTALNAPIAPNDDRVSMLENQIIDVTGRHAAAKSELEDWSARFAELAARTRQKAVEHEAVTRQFEAKQVELEKARTEVAGLDAKLMTIPNLEGEIADLHAQLVDRDERLDAWDSRFHASIGELRGEIGDLTARLHAQDAELLKMRAGAPAARAAAAGFAGTLTTSHIAGPRGDDARQLRELLASMSLRGVQFLPSSAELIPQSLPILTAAANAMHRFPDVRVEVAGHTDSWGTPEENLDLSLRRAGAVKEFLINSGIAAWRLSDVGYGHAQPVDSNDTADGRFANRRIEFHV